MRAGRTGLGEVSERLTTCSFESGQLREVEGPASR